MVGSSASDGPSFFSGGASFFSRGASFFSGGASVVRPASRQAELRVRPSLAAAAVPGGAGAGAVWAWLWVRGAVPAGVRELAAEGSPPWPGRLRPRARARDKRKVLGQRGRNPRHLLAARGAGDADAGPVERLLGHQVGNANFLEQFLHEQAVVAAIVGDDGTERRRIHHQRSVRRDHRRKAGGKAAEPALERIAPGGVDQGDLDAGAAAVDFAEHRLQAEAVAANIRLGPDLGVDRDHVALAADWTPNPLKKISATEPGLMRP